MVFTVSSFETCTEVWLSPSLFWDMMPCHWVISS